MKPFENQGLPVIFERSPSADKDELARNVALQRKHRRWTRVCHQHVEPSPTFDHRGTHITRRERPCGVVYQYQIHKANFRAPTTSSR